MPGGDSTGPRGSGSRTGRGLGYCADNSWPESFRPGLGLGFGRRRGWRHRARATGQPGWLRGGSGQGWWGTPPQAQDETALLQTQAEQLQAQLEAIQQRLTELEDK